MDILEIYIKQHRLAKEEFSHLIDGGEILRTPGGVPQKLRLTVIDGSLIDIFLTSTGRYSYHWERRHLDGTVYRHDNAPHERWRRIETFPKHFHNGSEADENCEASQVADQPDEALRGFLRFIEDKLAHRS
ncbi:MAG: hypothetical protein HY695_02585 [Deltaproteobacteria bacterium]|nr:hypothetical protein [Deltaproteobacteria bacterium]